MPELVEADKPIQGEGLVQSRLSTINKSFAINRNPSSQERPE